MLLPRGREREDTTFLNFQVVCWASSENGECFVRNHPRGCAAKVQREEDLPAAWHAGEGPGSRARRPGLSSQLLRSA